MNYYDPTMIASMSEHRNHNTLEGEENELYNRIRFSISDMDATSFAKETILKGPADWRQATEEVLELAAHPMTKRQALQAAVDRSYELAATFLLGEATAKRRFYGQLEGYRVSQRVVDQIDEAVLMSHADIIDDAKHDLAAKRLGIMP